MQPGHRHLTDEQIEGLLAALQDLDRDPPDVRECSECSRRLASHREGARVLGSLRDTGRRGDLNCPAPQVWWAIAAGVSKNSVDLLEHAASCRVCGPELKAALEGPAQLDSESSPFESPGSRANLARRIAEHRRRRPVLKYAALAAMLALASGAALLWFRASSAASLIALAYQEKRTVDFRFPGAGYAPLRVERDASQARTSRSLALVEAEAAVTRNLLQNPDDPVRLHQKAQVELLDWDYASALRHLQRAGALRPDDPAIIEDEALAYYERGRKEDQAQDLGESIELLAGVVANHPKDPTALFNLAVAQEQSMLYSDAALSWEHFLKLEPKGEWADEAREHLASLRKKLAARERDVRPCAGLTAQTVLSSKDLPAEVDRFEGGWSCLREHALTDWLSGAARNDRRAKAAVAAAGRAILEATGDTWFRDLMAGFGTPRFDQAALALSDAAAANLKAESGRAERSAKVAQSIFDRIGNRAGAAQAAIEYDYAIRRAQRPAECMAVLARLDADVLQSRWVWTSIEARLEKATCLSMAGDQIGGKRLAREAAELTSRRSHQGLHLRALSYLEGAEFRSGEPAPAWQHATEGLRQFWSGNQSAVWGYQIYYLLALAASEAGRDQLALDLQRETLAQIQRAARPSAEAFTWFDYGRTALRAGATGEAQTAFSTAARLYAALPRDRALETVLADCQVYLAQIDVLNHRPKEALARLAPVASEIEQGNSFAMELWFRRAVADADLQLGRTARRQDDLHKIIETSERALATLKTLRDQTGWARDNGQAYRQLAAEYALDEHQPERGLDAWEWFRAAPFRRAGEPPQSALAALDGARVDQALIYVTLEDRLLIWCVRQGSVSLRTVPVARSVLTGMSRELYALCSDPQASEQQWKASARRLAKYLIAPVESAVAWQRPVWVELDETLEAAPFPVLPFANGDPAGAVAAIAVFPGVEYLTQSRAPHPIASTELVLSVGVGSGLGTQLTPLPGAVEEANDVAGGFTAAKILVDRQATRANLERDLPQAVVFHFAGHLRQSASKAALLLAESEGAAELDAEGLAAMHLERCRLVVLSACSAEAPELFAETRTIRFSVGLLRAGVPGVLATRWDLDSGTARRFMKVFYRRLLSGDSAAQASSTAAASIRESPRTAHPYYWAAYQFFGRG